MRLLPALLLLILQSRVGEPVAAIGAAVLLKLLQATGQMTFTRDTLGKHVLGRAIGSFALLGEIAKEYGKEDIALIVRNEVEKISKKLEKNFNEMRDRLDEMDKTVKELHFIETVKVPIDVLENIMSELVARPNDTFVRERYDDQWSKMSPYGIIERLALWLKGGSTSALKAVIEYDQETGTGSRESIAEVLHMINIIAWKCNIVDAFNYGLIDKKGEMRQLIETIMNTPSDANITEAAEEYAEKFSAGYPKGLIETSLEIADYLHNSTAHFNDTNIYWETKNAVQKYLKSTMSTTKNRKEQIALVKRELSRFYTSDSFVIVAVSNACLNFITPEIPDVIHYSEVYDDYWGAANHLIVYRIKKNRTGLADAEAARVVSKTIRQMEETKFDLLSIDPIADTKAVWMLTPCSQNAPTSPQAELDTMGTVPANLARLVHHPMSWMDDLPIVFGPSPYQERVNFYAFVAM